MQAAAEYDLQEKKDYLNRARKADVLVNSYSRQLICLKDKATKATAALSSDFSGTANPKKSEDLIIQISELEVKLEEAISFLKETHEEVIDIISGINNPIYAEIIARRYLENQKWEQIAFEMNYDFRYVFKLHDRAVENLAILQCI